MTEQNETARKSAFPISDSGDDEWFAYLADQTRTLWKAHGYHVHAQTNQRRIVITEKRDA